MIYTPRSVITLHEYKLKHGAVQNPCVCTKIVFMGYEISISMDSSHGDGDLFRSDIRVYTAPENVEGVDVTSGFLRDDETMLYGDAETLLRIMEQIKEMQ